MFLHGRRHYSEHLRGDDNRIPEELEQFWKLYRLKYWGNVDNATWEANEISAKTNRGEIMAVYTLESGKEIFVTRMRDCSYVLFYHAEDIEFLEDMRKSRETQFRPPNGTTRGRSSINMHFS